jgi:hypothetical protein
MAGMVSERERSSSMSDWQLTDALARSAVFVTTTELLNVETPPSLESDFVLTEACVSGAASTTLQPVSRSCPWPCEGDARELAAATVAGEDGGGVEVAHMAAEAEPTPTPSRSPPSPRRRAWC